MHDATQEAELLGRVGPILTNVILRNSGVRADPLIEVCRPREDVSCMPLLWNFDHNGALQLEYVFVLKEKHLAGALPELVVKERIVVRLPRYLRDVEIRRDAEFVADPGQFPPIERFTFKPETDALDGVEVLAKSVVRLAGIRQNFLHISREGNLEATRKSRLPVDQVPLAASKPILSALHKGGRDTEFRTDQVPPLVPGRVKRKRQ